MKQKHQKKISVLICIAMIMGITFSPVSLLEAEAIEDPFVYMYDSDEKFLKELKSIMPEDNNSSSNSKFEQELLTVYNEDAKFLEILEQLKKEETLQLTGRSNSDSSEALIKALYDQSRTNRFIIKYKESEKAYFEKSANKIQTLLSESFQTTEIKENMQKIVLNAKVNPKEFAEALRNNGIGKEIEYIQPDFSLSVAGLELTYSIVDEENKENSEYYNKPSEKNKENVQENSDNQISDDKNSTQQNVINRKYKDNEEQNKQEIIVAVIDTGVDINHSDLEGRVTKAWNIVQNNNQIYDDKNPIESMHGTHIAGIIANNSSGYVKIMPLKVFEGRQAYTTDIIEAIKYAQDNGAKIVNCSFGGQDNNPALKEAIENSDMLFIAAAGNSRSDLNEIPFYPAAFELDNIISVASLNKDDGFSYYSNYSTQKIDIAALGKQVESSMPQNSCGVQSGTSVSAGFVSAAAAEMYSFILTDISKTVTSSAISTSAAISYKNEEQNKQAYTQLVKSCILEGADRLSNLQNKVSEGRRLNINNSIEGIKGQYLSPETEDDFDVHEYNPTPEQQYKLFNIGGNPKKIEAGHKYALVLLENGTVWEWGRNNTGFSQVIGLKDIVDISVGYRYSMALDKNQLAFIWESGTQNIVPAQNGYDITNIAAGDFHVSYNFELYTSLIYILQMGNFYYGGVADYISFMDSYYPVPSIITKTSAGSESILLHQEQSGNQKITVIGNRQHGAFAGDNIFIDKGVGISILYNQQSITQVEAGQYQTFALKSDGKVLHWGRDKYNNNLALKPITDNITNVKQISAGGSDLYNVPSFVAFLKNDGTVYEYSTIHNGRVNIDNVKQISAGSECTIALKNDGSIWGWGKSNIVIGYGEEIIKEPVQIYPVIDESTRSIIDIQSGRQYDVILSAKAVNSFENKEFIFKYDTSDLELIDLCIFTKGNQTTAGLIEISGVKVEEIKPGTIKFTVQKQIPNGKRWSGALMSIRFKTKATTISVLEFSQQTK